MDHGFDRFLAILKLSILFLKKPQTIIISTLMEIGTISGLLWGQKRIFGEGSKMAQNRPQTMDYSPWSWSILGHFETVFFNAYNYSEDHYINSVGDWNVSGLIWRQKGFLVRGQKWPKIDPKPWTIVHGSDRFWAILKLSILMRKITQKIIISILLEIGTFLG